MNDTQNVYQTPNNIAGDALNDVNHHHHATSKSAVLLINLGTPNAPTVSAVRAYLRAFLSDRRVIEMPKVLWMVILHCFVLTFRPKKVAHAYQSIWTHDSPMRVILHAQAAKLTQRINAPVYVATTYGAPNIARILPKMQADGIEKIIALPLYPQYSATSTAAAFDAMARVLMKTRNIPALHFIKDYHNHPLYIAALAQSVRKFWQKRAQADVLVMSFHGIPQVYADKGDPYEAQCHISAALLAEALGLQNEQWRISFQSRFGAQKWLSPYTNMLLGELGAQKKSVHIISPAFSADCLETLEELAVENKQVYFDAGGTDYAYIDALNDTNAHINLMQALIAPYL